MAIDYLRAVAAYQIAAEAGHALSQHQVGMMYYKGRGVDVDLSLIHISEPTRPY